MHVPEEAITGRGQAIAIIGAALRFPGAADPSSLRELTLAGRRVFRALDSDAPPGTVSQDRQQADQRSLLAALLDDQARADELAGGITARHALAAETAAAAL